MERLSDTWPPGEACTGALAGLRVLDLSRILSGPYCTMVLADLGADVIKVEDPLHGDDTRSWGPPFQGADAAYYLSINRNKRSLAIDLKSDGGRQVAATLAAAADVIVENFRPGVMRRLGLDYPQVAATNPGIIYASISGYGHTGPYADRPGYDAIAQAESGIMSVTGEADRPPVRVGVSSADLGAGMWTGIGILAALASRTTTGRGQHVDISLFDGQFAWLSYIAGGYFASGQTPPRYGSAHPTIVPYQAFPTGDGWLMVAAGNDKLWRRFADAIGLAELCDDRLFATNAARVRNRAALVIRIEQALSVRSTDEWTKTLVEAGVPVGPINTVDEAVRHPQALARSMIVELDHPEAGTVRTIGSPVHLSATPPSARTPPPTHGQHTQSILAALGIHADEVALLNDRGIVRAMNSPSQS